MNTACLEHLQVSDYDTKLYPFRAAAERLLGQCDLEHLHTLPGAPTERLQVGKDNHTPFHNRFYDGLKGSEFESVYLAFIAGVVRPEYDEPIIFQRRPTFRIQFVGNVGTGAFHKDKDYQHPVEEVNYWVPVTDAWGTNTIWVETGEDNNRLHPVRVDYGQFFQFAGGRFTHGSVPNDTNSTRVSFDFRVIPESQYQDRPDLVGITFGKRRVLGDYYQKME